MLWQTSDREEYHAGIHAWLRDAGLDNVLAPLVLDVDDVWPDESYDAVFSANTAHIMSWPQVQRFFEAVGQVLQTGGIFALYGPFNYGGRYSSESNANFDQWLKQRDPLSGVRDFEALDGLADAAGLVLRNDYEMPANNRILVWTKSR